MLPDGIPVWSTLVLIVWAVALFSNPVNAAIFPQLQSISRAAHFDNSARVGLFVGARKLHEPYDPLNRRGAPFFIGGPWSFANYIFRENIRFSHRARGSAFLGVNGNDEINDSISKPYSSWGYCDSSMHGCRKNSIRQGTVIAFRYFLDYIGMLAQVLFPMTFHSDYPIISNGIDKSFGSLLFSEAGMRDSVAGFFCCVPSRPSGKFYRRGVTGDSDNHLVAKCGDLTVRITWNAFEKPSTISRHNELLVYQLKSNDGTGVDLGRCELTKEQRQNTAHPFHLILKSGGASFAVGIPGKELLCFDCEAIEVGNDGDRFGIISFRASPVLTKHDRLSPQPSRE